MIELRVEVRPAWTFRLPRRGGLDALTRVRGGVLHRLLHTPSDEPVIVRVAQVANDRVLFGAQAGGREAAAFGIERMRHALGVDLDLRPFYELFRFDPLIGRSVRTNPSLRPPGKPSPFEALAWAICEQLIEIERAGAIQRRLAWRLGRSSERSLGLSWDGGSLRDSPAASTLAQQAPAMLESLGLSAGRSLALVRAAREVAGGRIDLFSAEPEPGWMRLRAIPGVGPWTVQMLALTGQARLDQLPAGDLAYLKLVGRIRSGGDPWARATVAEVQELFEPYAPWAGLAGLHALRAASTAPGRASLPAAA